MYDSKMTKVPSTLARIKNSYVLSTPETKQNKTKNITLILFPLYISILGAAQIDENDE